MLIVHWDYDFPIIRKAKLICEKTENNKDNYYFKLNNDIIAEGDNNVKKILNGINGNFTEKGDDFFYIINVRIKILDFFKDIELKYYFFTFSHCIL